MRARSRLIRSLVILALWSGTAAADPRPKPRRIQPPSAEDVGLKGTLPAPANPPGPLAGGSLSLQTPPAAPSPALAARPSFGALRALRDAEPLCRQACAEGRITCIAAEDQSCDAHWAQCVVDCSYRSADAPPS